MNHPESIADDFEAEAPTAGSGGSSGGRLQREIGARADEIEQVEGRARPVSVHKGDKPRGGDEPNLSNRDDQRKGGRVPPRRS